MQPTFVHTTNTTNRTTNAMPPMIQDCGDPSTTVENDTQHRHDMRSDSTVSTTAKIAGVPESTIVFPPSPQWNQSHSACLFALSEEKGWLLYSLNDSIHVLNPFTLKHVSVLKGGHFARVQTVAAAQPFSVAPPTTTLIHSANPENLELTMGEPSTTLSSVPLSPPISSGSTGSILKCLVASAGEDMNVVCWDLTTMSKVATLTHVHQKEVRAVCWTASGTPVDHSWNDGHEGSTLMAGSTLAGIATATTLVAAPPDQGGIQYLISADKGGSVVVWDPAGSGKHIKVELPERPTIMCMSSCPSNPSIVAIGLQSGDILLCSVSLKTVEIVHRLHGHTGRITSLAWQPASAVPSKSKSPFHITLLASGSGDQTVRVWNISKDKTEKMFSVTDQNQDRQSSKALSWVPVQWSVDGREIMSSMGRGMVISWPLQGQAIATKFYKGFNHNRQVFQIMTWRFSGIGSFAFTFSMDRKLIVWDVQSRSREGVGQVDCIGGNVYMMDISLREPTKLAMALGNENIKIWNTAPDAKMAYESTNLEQFQSKVRAVRWHPQNEGKICFGLENGKIGVIDNVYRSGEKGGGTGRGSKNKLPQSYFQSYHENPVVAVAWCAGSTFVKLERYFKGDVNKASSDQIIQGDERSRGGTEKEGKVSSSLHEQCSNHFVVISCGGGSGSKLLVSDPSKPTSKSKDLNQWIKIANSEWYRNYEIRTGSLMPSRRDFAIHPNRDLMAIGNEDGSVEVFDLRRQLRLVYVFQGHKKAVARVRWNCTEFGQEVDDVEDDVSADNGAQEERPTLNSRYLLASASEDGSLAIHELCKLAGGDRSFSSSKPVQNSTSDRDESAEILGTKEEAQELLVIPSTLCYVNVRYHNRAITDVVWSPHNMGLGSTFQLATSSSDGKVVVYEFSLPRSGTEIDMAADSKVASGPIACYMGHEGPVLSLAWSLMHESRIISGGSDWCVCDWDWKEHRVIGEDHIHALYAKGTGRDYSNRQKRGMVEGEVNGARGRNKRKKQGQQQELSQLTSEQAESQSPSGPHAIPLPSCSENLKGPSVSSVTTFASSSVEPTSTTSLSSPSPLKKIGGQEPLTTAGAFMHHQGQSLVSGSRLNLFPLFSAKLLTPDRRTELYAELVLLVWQLWFVPKAVSEEDIQLEEEDQEELDDASGRKARWERMLCFFEEDGEEDGMKLAKLLRQSQVDAHHADQAHESDTIGGDNALFCGSRAEVRALAGCELAALSMVSRSNPFLPGTGMGIFFPSTLESSANAGSANTQSNKSLGQIPLSYWLGDIPQVTDILQSLPSSEVGIQDWINLALAPMAGKQHWQNLMDSTAQRFLQKNEIHAATLLWLAVGKVKTAVEAFMKCGMYRESLMLLKLRLWEDEPDDSQAGEELTKTESTGSKLKESFSLEVQILTLWSRQLEKNEQYESCAKCLFALGRRSIDTTTTTTALQSMALGLRALAHRGDSASLRCVAGLSILAAEGNMIGEEQVERVRRYQASLLVTRNHFKATAESAQ